MHTEEAMLDTCILCSQNIHFLSVLGTLLSLHRSKHMAYIRKDKITSLALLFSIKKQESKLFIRVPNFSFKQNMI